MGALADAVVDGTLRCRVDSGRVLRFEPTPFDVELLDVVDAAVESAIPLAVVFPLAGTAAPMLIGAASLLGAVRRTGNLGVSGALVAANLTSRMLYDRLHFRDQRLGDFLPRATVDLEGNVHVIGKPRHDSAGRLYMVGRPDRLRPVERDLAAVVIDESSATPSSVRELLRQSHHVRQPIVYMTTNPFDPTLDVIRAVDGVVWAWPAERIVELVAKCGHRPRPSAGPLVASSELLACAAACPIELDAREFRASSALDDSLARAWRALGSLARALDHRSRATGTSSFESMWWAWGVLNTLVLLPAPPARYDRWVGSNPYVIKLMDASDIARQYAGNASGAVRDGWLQVADAFGDAIVAASEGVRLEGAISWISEQVNADAQGVLVTRNRAAVSATREALNESPFTPLGWAENVRVITLTEFSSGRLALEKPGAVYLPGPLPKSKAGMLALPAATNLRMQVVGEFEARRASAQVVSTREAMLELDAKSRSDASTRLGIRTSTRKLDAVDRVSVLGGNGYERTDRPSGWSDVGSPWEPFEPAIAESLRRRVESDHANYMGGDGGGVRTAWPEMERDVEVIVVELDHGVDDKLSLISRPNDLVTRRRSEMIERVAAKALCPGDILLLVDHGARHDLLGTVIERLAETPEYATLHYLIEYWKTRARRVVKLSLTYREILRRMDGTRLTSEQAIGTWVRGTVDGPRDPHDVARFAKAVGDSELAKEAERVGWALSTVHDVHRRLGRWLSKRLTTLRSSDDPMILDQGSHVHVIDLLDAVTEHKVVDVDALPRRAPASVIGSLLDSSQADALPVN